MKEIEVKYEIFFNSNKDSECKTIVFEMNKKLEKWLDKTFFSTIWIEAEARDNGWYLIIRSWDDHEELMKKKICSLRKDISFIYVCYDKIR